MTIPLTSKFKQDLQDLAAQLRRVRDEVKVNAHLASMDAKEELEKLEKQWDGAEKYWNEISEASVAAAKDLKTRFEQLRDRLKSLKTTAGSQN